MIIDNFIIFKSWFDKLEKPEEFYFVQIIQRKKDGNELPSYTSGARTLRSFYFFDLEHFEREEQHIKEICDNNNARAYFWVNVRNTKDIAFSCVKQFIELIEQGNTNQGLTVWDRACGANQSKDHEKLWIIDIDKEQLEHRKAIVDALLKCRRNESNCVKYVIPTLNGEHWLSTKFDRRAFPMILSELNIPVPDIHKNNPTLLYYKSCQD